MKRPSPKGLRWLALIAAALAFGSVAHAGDADIRTSDGERAGAFQYRDIVPADSPLEFDRGARGLIRVIAGPLGNHAYREIWQFEAVAVIYERLIPGAHYPGDFLTRESGRRLICGDTADNSQCSAVVAVRQPSRRVVAVAYRDRFDNAACAGLIYVGEETRHHGPGDGWGDYFVRALACDRATGSTLAAIDVARQALLSIRKDGRYLVEARHLEQAALSP